MKSILKEIKKIIKDFPEIENPWKIAEELEKYKFEKNENVMFKDVFVTDESVIICGENCVIQPTVMINGIVLLGNNVFIGAHSIIRGRVFIGENTKIGPYNDVYNSLIGSDTKISHRNDIFNSYIGSNCWLSSNVSIHNVKLNEKKIEVNWNGESEKFDKFGAIIEDNVSIGVWAKIMPGSVINKKRIIGPCVISGTNKIRKIL